MMFEMFSRALNFYLTDFFLIHHVYHVDQTEMAIHAQNAGAVAFVKKAYGSPPGLWAYGEQ